MPTTKLSQSVAEKIKPHGVDEVYFDEKLPGFGLRVSGSGNKTWIIQTRIKGRQIKRKIGKIEILGYADAKSQAIDILRQIQIGEDPFEKSAPTTSDFKQLFSVYMDVYAWNEKKQRSAEEDLRLIQNHLLPRLRKISPEQLSRQDVADLKNSVAGLKNRGDGPTRLSRPPKRLSGGKVTANRCLALLKKVMNFAIQGGHLERSDNPVSGVKAFPERRKEHFLGLEEVDRLRRAIRKSRKLRTEKIAVLDAIELLLLTGSRKNEINALRWQEVDLERGCMNLKDTKTGFRKIPLSERAIQILRRRSKWRKSDLVFPSRTGKTAISLRKPWERLRTAAEIGPENTLHTLRHTFATQAAANGKSAWEIQELLGHKSIQTTSIYVKIANDQNRRNMQFMSDLYHQRAAS